MRCFVIHSPQLTVFSDFSAVEPMSATLGAGLPANPADISERSDQVKKLTKATLFAQFPPLRLMAR